MRTFFLIFVMIILSSCTGGGSSTSGSSSVVKELYYGFSSDNYELVEQPEPSMGANVFLIPSVGYINVIDENTNSVDYMVFKPTCLSGSSTETYAMVLVSGNGPNKISAKRSSLEFTVFDYQFKSYNERVSLAPNSNYSLACNSGKTTVDTQGLFYGNGSMAVFENNGDIYLGIRDNLLVTSGSPSFTATKYEFFKANSEVIENSWAGMDVGLLQTNHFVAGGIFEVFGFNVTINYFNQNSGDTSSHISLQPSSDPSMKGIFGQILGHRLFVSVYEPDGIGGASGSDSSCYPDGSDPNLASCNGVGSIVILFEN